MPQGPESRATVRTKLKVALRVSSGGLLFIEYNANMRGKFIVFEGGGGTGKDTLIDLLKKKLAGRENIVYTRDPGGTPMGERIRELLLAPEAKEMHPRTELLLFLAARTELVEKIIAPALQAGKTVVSNRFALSTIAYQIYGRQQQSELPLVAEALRYIARGVVPDICFLLDTPPETAIKRARKRPGEAHRFVAEDLDFQKRVYDGYKRHLAQFAKKGVIIDTSGPIENAWKEVEKALQSYIKS